MSRDRLDRGIALYKECLETGRPEKLFEFLDGLEGAGRAHPEIMGALLEFARGERARLIKLRTLGFSRGFEARLGLTERFIARLEKEEPFHE